MVKNIKRLNTKYKDFEDKVKTLETQSQTLESKTDDLNINEDIKLDRAHRLGKPRPIVVKFHSYKDRELVRTTAQTKAAELKSINQGVGIQQTKSVLQKRKTMNVAYEREKAAGRTVKWAGAKLLVRDGDVGNFREVKE